MKVLRIVVVVVLALGIGLITFNSDYLIHLGIASWNLGWMASYLFPKVLVLGLSAVLIVIIWAMLRLSVEYKFLISLLILGFSIGGYLIVNPPYIEWTKTGTELTDEVSGIPITEYLNNNRAAFDGIVCLALPGCPHCEVAISRLALVKKRVPKLDVLIFVFTEDSSRVGSFQKKTGVDELPFVLVPDPATSSMLCQGSFPGFLYYKNGKIVQRWFNSEFGYLALDWVEAGLN